MNQEAERRENKAAGPPEEKGKPDAGQPTPKP